ncbi:MAG: thiamine diphosphokinase [Acidimicrobiia bacterium]|nr:thiamine diphosphokinase [Acidimicrobiia bacterium]
MTTTVVVITGATPLSRRAVAAVAALVDETGDAGSGIVLVAADGGLDHALAAGLRPTVLVGDLDSVTASGLAWASEHTTVVRHPVDKAATDTELAVAHAASMGPQRILLVAGQGDRIDHAVAALGALGAPELAAVGSLEAWGGDDELRVVHGPGTATLDRPAGTTFSVLAMHGPCRGVTIANARWPLSDHDLQPLVGLGVSNQVAVAPVTVSVEHGIATVVVPEAN